MNSLQILQSLLSGGLKIDMSSKAQMGEAEMDLESEQQEDIETIGLEQARSTNKVSYTRVWTSIDIAKIVLYSVVAFHRRNRK